MTNIEDIAQPTVERRQNCPTCGALVVMVPYDIGSGPEMSCPCCEWCWGADGQPLNPLRPPDLLLAPFSAAQVDALNRWQSGVGLHPFTCLFNSDDILVATEAGWVCPDPNCAYTQDWAHAFMAGSASATVKQHE